MEPTILASFITVLALVIIALGSVFFKFGQLTSLVEAIRRENTRRHDDIRREAQERYEGIQNRLIRLEDYFIARLSGDD